jgi:hypothetical protein
VVRNERAGPEKSDEVLREGLRLEVPEVRGPGVLALPDRWEGGAGHRRGDHAQEEGIPDADQYNKCRGYRWDHQEDREECGKIVVLKTEVPMQGMRAYFVDTEGVVTGIMQPLPMSWRLSTSVDETTSILFYRVGIFFSVENIDINIIEKDNSNLSIKTGKPLRTFETVH